MQVPTIARLNQEMTVTLLVVKQTIELRALNRTNVRQAILEFPKSKWQDTKTKDMPYP